MKSYHVDVDMKFTVAARSEDEARDTAMRGFAEGRYIPLPSEVMVDGFVGKDRE